MNNPQRPRSIRELAATLQKRAATILLKDLPRSRLYVGKNDDFDLDLDGEEGLRWLLTTGWDLRVLRNCGEATYRHILGALAQHGLRLGMTKGEVDVAFGVTAPLKPPVFPRGDWLSADGDEPSTQACWSCAFWDRYGLNEDGTAIRPEEGAIGACKRYPPTQSEIDEGHTFWPIVTDPHSWCGEWKERSP